MRGCFSTASYPRRHHAYGPQYDYFDHWNRVGWIRLGDAGHPEAMAVLLSDGLGGGKRMEVGKPNAKFVDPTEHGREPVPTTPAGASSSVGAVRSRFGFRNRSARRVPARGEPDRLGLTDAPERRNRMQKISLFPCQPLRLWLIFRAYRSGA